MILDFSKKNLHGAYIERVIRSKPNQPSRSSYYDPRTFYHELNVLVNVQDLQPLKIQLRNEPLNQITT